MSTEALGRGSSVAWDDSFEHVLEPTHGLGALRLPELISFRELLYFLTWRDIKVRYKQTALGVIWAILQPVLAMILFSIVFSDVAKISSQGVPYPIFSYCALVPWLFFANSVQLSSLSLTLNPNLITKVYFPRVYVVTSPILASLVDFALASVILIGLMIYYSVAPRGVGVILLVPLLLLALMTTFGVSAWLAALNVKYRDVRFAVPFMIQVWMFASPVVYSVAALPAAWRDVYGLNPMSTVIEGFRWALVGTPPPSAGSVLLSVLTGLIIFVGGLLYFNRTERRFADIV